MVYVRVLILSEPHELNINSVLPFPSSDARCGALSDLVWTRRRSSVWKRAPARRGVAVQNVTSTIAVTNVSAREDCSLFVETFSGLLL